MYKLVSYQTLTGQLLSNIEFFKNKVYKFLNHIFTCIIFPACSSPFGHCRHCIRSIILLPHCWSEHILPILRLQQRVCRISVVLHNWIRRLPSLWELLLEKVKCNHHFAPPLQGLHSGSFGLWNGHLKNIS